MKSTWIEFESRISEVSYEEHFGLDDNKAIK